MVDWLHTTCSVLIPDLFQTFSNKETQSNDPPYSAPIPTKKIQSNDLTYSNKENTKQQSTIPHLFQQRNTKQQPQLFRTFSNKETTKQRPGMEIGVEAGHDSSAGRRTWADPLYLKFRIKYLRVRLITRIQ